MRTKCVHRNENEPYRHRNKNKAPEKNRGKTQRHERNHLEQNQKTKEEENSPHTPSALPFIDEARLSCRIPILISPPTATIIHTVTTAVPAAHAPDRAERHTPGHRLLRLFCVDVVCGDDDAADGVDLDFELVERFTPTATQERTQARASSAPCSAR